MNSKGVLTVLVSLALAAGTSFAVPAPDPLAVFDSTNPGSGDIWQDSGGSPAGGAEAAHFFSGADWPSFSTDTGNGDRGETGLIVLSGQGPQPAGFQGDIAFVRLYGRPLSAAEVAANYQSTIPEPATLCLLGLGGLALLRRRR